MKEKSAKQAIILIADDNPENLRILGDMLKTDGYKIRIAKNGRSTLESIRAAEPDMLLLDVHMPELDGFEVCKTIRGEWGNDRLPIIFLSALSDTFNKIEAFNAGASDYITKPFEIKEVKARILNQLKVHRLQSENDELRSLLFEKDEEIDRLKKRKR